MNNNKLFDKIQKASIGVLTDETFVKHKVTEIFSRLKQSGMKEIKVGKYESISIAIVVLQ